ncbi:MAG: sporulation transcriptional regulator SpoIIID [Lachnospiraceae bacterium]
MNDYIEERVITIAHYIIETKSTVRSTAKKFGVSKSTVHKDAGVIIGTVNAQLPLGSWALTVISFLSKILLHYNRPTLLEEAILPA